MYYIRGTFIVLILATGCGKPTLQIDPALQPYITRFEQASNGTRHPVKVLNLIAILGEVAKDGENGLCEAPAFDTPKITIDQNTFNEKNDPWIEMIVFHELGHCVLSRGHTDATWILPNGAQEFSSVMHAGLVDIPNYLANQDHYITELFSEAP